MITADDLARIAPGCAKRAETYAPFLSAAMSEFDIDNGARECAFLAQILHESGCLRYTHELASGEAYEGRADLGNTQPGDGMRFKGRGLIQITGRANYTKLSEAFGQDLIAAPELLEAPGMAARSAAWWWKAHGCNEIADTGDFVRLTKRINGGTNGLASRQAYWQRAQDVLGG